MKMRRQVGAIMYGGGLNVRHWVNAAIEQGYVVVWRAGYAAIYETKETRSWR